MKIKIKEATNLSNKILEGLGFSKEEARLITDNLIDAELSGKKSHGLIRIPSIKRLIDAGKVSASKKKISIKKETPVSLLIDGKNKPAFYVINKALEIAFKKIKRSPILSVGITNATYASGFIGSYARKATEKDLIFLGFNNSPGGLVPYGSKKELWGTNPLTVGIPTNKLPIILDMASSKITWGTLLVADQEKKKIPRGVAIDKDGIITTDPEKAMEGGLLPIAEHKGSGLAFIVEILAGALTYSRVGYSVPGGWGTFIILIKPSILRPIAQFKKDVETAIEELKNAPRMKGFKAIYFPGERSQKLRFKHLKEGEFKLNNSLYKTLRELLKRK